VLLSAGPWHHPGHAQLITTAADLHTLLGPDTAGLQAAAGLTVVDRLDDAIAVLEQQTLTRARLTAPHPPTPHRQPPPDTGFPPPPARARRDPVSPPPGLVPRSPTDPAPAVRLAVLLRGPRLGITGVLLGRWPHGETWQVDEDGYTHTADTTAVRLCMLT